MYLSPFSFYHFVKFIKLQFLLTAVFLIYGAYFLTGQEVVSDLRVVTGNEKSYAILLNSNGWGINYRNGKRLDGFRKRLIDLDFAYVRHSKEIKTQNPYYENQKRFIFGKLHYMYTFRTGLGLQKEIFSKFDKGGVAIKYFYSGGFSLGLLKPIYYEVVDSSEIIDNRRVLYISNKLFDYSIHQVSDIYSRSSFFRGFGETKMIPGLFLKLGLSFVYSNAYETINALDAGIVFDAFYKEFKIMATEKKDQFLVSLFVNYRFGKVGIKNKKTFDPEE